MRGWLLVWQIYCLFSFIPSIFGYIHQEDYQKAKDIFNKLSPDSVETQKDALHKTVQKLLDFKQPPSQGMFSSFFTSNHFWFFK